MSNNKRKITRNPDLLANVEEIPWLEGKYTTSGDRGYVWDDFKPNHLFMGHDWFIEKFRILSKAQSGELVLDIGCKGGLWIKDAREVLVPGVITLGADPSNYGADKYLNYYYCCAIDNVSYSSTTTFYTFDEEGCNSLRPKSEHLTMRNMLNAVQIPVRSLENILLEKFNNNTIIHYLKTDCQGKDVDVVKSLRSFLPQTKYVQIECSLNEDFPFYDGQPSYEQDIEEMDKLGFKPIYWMNLSLSPLPEGEILFKNKNLT